MRDPQRQEQAWTVLLLLSVAVFLGYALWLSAGGPAGADHERAGVVRASVEL